MLSVLLLLHQSPGRQFHVCWYLLLFTLFRKLLITFFLEFFWRMMCLSLCTSDILHLWDQDYSKFCYNASFLKKKSISNSKRERNKAPWSNKWPQSKQFQAPLTHLFSHEHIHRCTAAHMLQSSLSFIHGCHDSSWGGQRWLVSNDALVCSMKTHRHGDELISEETVELLSRDGSSETIMSWESLSVEKFHTHLNAPEVRFAACSHL